MLLKGGDQPGVLQCVFELVLDVNALWPFFGFGTRCGDLGRRTLFTLLGSNRHCRAIPLRTPMATCVRRSSVGGHGDLAGTDYSTHRDLILFTTKNDIFSGCDVVTIESTRSAFSSGKLSVTPILPRTTAALATAPCSWPTLDSVHIIILSAVR